MIVIDFVLVAVTAVIIGMMAVMTVILTQLSSRLRGQDGQGMGLQQLIMMMVIVATASR